MRILHCLRAPVGGLFRHVCDLATAQARLGHDVGIVCDALATDRLTEARLDALAPSLALGLRRVAIHRSLRITDIGGLAAIRDHARALRLDVLHGHGAKGGAFARLAARALKREGGRLASFYTPHGGSLNFGSSTIEGRVYMGLERYLARHTDGLIFESDFARRIYAQQVGPVAAAVRVIPNGLLPHEFATHAPDAGAADLLFIGELRPVKGVDTLLHALAAVRARRPVRAVIVGSGPDRAMLEALSAQLDLSTCVRFAGALPAAEAMKQARAMVVPSRAESLPYVVLEAAAAGMPLITTGVGGIPEIVAGTDMPLLPADNVPALAAALLTHLETPHLSRNRADRLQAAVAKRFTVARMTADVLAFYADPRRSSAAVA